MLNLHLRFKPPSSCRILFRSGGHPGQFSCMKKFRYLVVPVGYFRKGIPLVIMLNIHFENDYVPSCAYERELFFNHLDLTSSELTVPRILAHNCHLYLHFSVRTTRGKARRAHDRALSPQPAPPSDPPPPPSSTTYSPPS